jgi:hypothetical protein
MSLVTDPHKLEQASKLYVVNGLTIGKAAASVGICNRVLSEHLRKSNFLRANRKPVTAEVPGMKSGSRIDPLEHNESRGFRMALKIIHQSAAVQSRNTGNSNDFN